MEHFQRNVRRIEPSHTRHNSKLYLELLLIVWIQWWCMVVYPTQRSLIYSMGWTKSPETIFEYHLELKTQIYGDACFSQAVLIWCLMSEKQVAHAHTRRSERILFKYWTIISSRWFPLTAVSWHVCLTDSDHSGRCFRFRFLVRVGAGESESRFDRGLGDGVELGQEMAWIEFGFGALILKTIISEA